MKDKKIEIEIDSMSHKRFVKYLILGLTIFLLLLTGLLFLIAHLAMRGF